MKLRFFSNRLVKLTVLLCLLAILFLPASGCSEPAVQGWSGFAGSEGKLYFVSIDGKVIALNISARSTNSPFPSEGEWVVTVRSQAAPGGSICGPACAPAAQPTAVYATPVVAGNLVYVATYAGDNGKVMAINRLAPGYDKEGIPSWTEGEWYYPKTEKKFIGAVVGSPIVVKDTLYVGSSDGKLYALDAVKGKEKWKNPFDTGGKIWTSPAVSDGVVYVSNFAKKLCAISSETGELLWQVEFPVTIASSPVVSGGNIVFGTFDNYIYGVSSSDGKERWKFKGDGWFWASPLAKDGVVYAGCLDRRVYAIEASTGKELWRFDGDSSFVAPPVLVEDSLVICSESGSLYILDAAKGTMVKTVPIGHVVMAPIYSDGNRVYVHARDRNVYCVDLQDGQIAWKFSSVIVDK